MKKFKLFLIGLMTLLFVSGCDTYGQVYYDDYDGISYSTIVTYGTPYYYDSVIGYYYYKGLFYYPYLWNNVWYFRPYHRPHPYGWRFVPDRYWRPTHRLGDHNGYHRHNYGPSHRDMGREYGRGGGNHYRVEPRSNGGRIGGSTIDNTRNGGHTGRPMGDVRGTNTSRSSIINSSTRVTVRQSPVSRGSSVMSGSRSSVSPSSRGMGSAPSRGSSMGGGMSRGGRR